MLFIRINRQNKFNGFGNDGNTLQQIILTLKMKNVILKRR